MLDNSSVIAKFCPGGEFCFPLMLSNSDAGVFIYSEMLDRGKRKGNNGHRLVKTFYHRSVEEFWEQWPTIKALCDMTNVRTCTRLSPRTFKRVGKKFTEMVVESALTDNSGIWRKGVPPQPVPVATQLKGISEALGWTHPPEELIAPGWDLEEESWL